MFANPLPFPGKPKVPAETLLQRLSGSLVHLHQLRDELDCRDDDIAQTLASPDFNEGLKLRMDLAFAQARLIAIEALPQLALKLFELTSSDKPEVVRRSIAQLMGIAGLPTMPQRHEPVPSARPYDPDKFSDQEQRAIKNAKILERRFGIDLARIYEGDMPDLVQHIQEFLRPRAAAQAKARHAAAQNAAAQAAAQTAPAVAAALPVQAPAPVLNETPDSSEESDPEFPSVTPDDTNPNTINQALSSPPDPDSPPSDSDSSDPVPDPSEQPALSSSP